VGENAGVIGSRKGKEFEEFVKNEDGADEGEEIDVFSNDEDGISLN
jgi:hypothetical protein